MKRTLRWWLPWLALHAGSALCAAGSGDGDPFASPRARMVDEDIATRGVDHAATLAALRAVPRHRFVPAAYLHQAYADRPLPIGHGQTISQPYIVGYMTEQLRPVAGQRILEVGTGSGYQAAILQHMGVEVYTIEIVPPLAERAGKLLREELKLERVAVRTGDGYDGWPEAAPFDAIIVTAAAETIPPPLIAQLKDGGRMIIPVGPALGAQYLVLVTKDDGTVRTRTLLPVRFVPFTRSSE